MSDNTDREELEREPPRRVWIRFEHFRSRSILVGEPSLQQRSADDVEYVRAAVAVPDFRCLLKPDAWHCQKCAGPLTFHAENSQAYSCERCEMMWPAENIILFGYADLTDESFTSSPVAPSLPEQKGTTCQS